ncbi:hypothetical protein DA798_11365 [Lactobacillus sp. PFC-70]|nr:hypothetical protein DA798_11365 [Lactobacillus sp. PFC-70]
MIKLRFKFLLALSVLGIGVGLMNFKAPVIAQAKLKHTVTIKGKKYASKYTLKQIRNRYHLKYKVRKISGMKTYTNKVWAYKTSARSGFWDYTQPKFNHYKTHKGRYIVFKTWMGGNMSTLKAVNLTTGKKYVVNVAHWS